MKELLFIGCGSFCGGVLRHLIGRYVGALLGGPLSWGTLCVNVLGCLLLGFLSAKLVLGQSSIPQEWRLALTVGFCGGFTTFSTFANENFLHWQNGAWHHALLYTGLSFALGLMAIFAGYWLARIL